MELVLTLGTGLGSALYVDGILVPNLEIAHHVFRKNRSYEECLGNVALKRMGKAKWSRRFREAFEQLAGAFNFRKMYIGGGNARKLKGKLPDNVEIVSNVAGLLGCIRLWDSGA